MGDTNTLIGETMKEITLPIDLANAVLGYLGKQPYDQVFPLIQGILCFNVLANDVPTTSFRHDFQFLFCKSIKTIYCFRVKLLLKIIECRF